MRFPLLSLLAVALLAALLAAAPAAARLDAAGRSAAQPAPTGLRGFLLRADEVSVDTFARTPSFAWSPYRGARSYDFQVATSRIFDESSIVWSTGSRTKPLQVPAVSVPVALPWMTGHPYALYARVRARTASGLTPWSTPFGFNMRWRSLPERLTPEHEGLVRWKPVEGATSYELWFVEPGKVIKTATNVVDQREYYTFHPTAQFMGTVTWRVRAVRKIYGKIPNGLPTVSHGPWSETFVTVNSEYPIGPMIAANTASDVVSTPTLAQSHSITPAYVFRGNAALDGTAARLFRVYVATDRQCVNIVYKGAIVGSPAYAPRLSGPLALPTTVTGVEAAAATWLLDDPTGAGAEGKQTLMADYTSVRTSELDGETTTATTSTVPAEFKAIGSLVNLWDSGWPTGRYYWTVVPVKEVTSGTSIFYQDAEVPQDACATGRVFEFGKASQPTTTAQSRPYASGLSPTGTLVAAAGPKPTFYRAALIAWAPALGATGYEVQWSRTKYPWRAAAKPYYTAATSVLLEGLAPGTWFYRVRGIDPYVPGPIKEMTWSEPVEIVLAKPTFSVERPPSKKKNPTVVVTRG